MYENVDSNEIKKFEQLAATWWDTDGQSQALHQINPLRLDYVMQRANGLFGKKVLDIGCGGGILSESMAREGALVTGIDMGAAALAVAKQHAEQQQLSIDYQQITAECYAHQHPAEFDVITCMEMLEHIPNPQRIVQACAQLIKPGGHVFFATINRNLQAWLLMVVGAEYLAKIVPPGTHDPKRFIRPSELLSWTQKTMLRERHITGISYQPLSGHFTLSANVKINYILHTQCAEH